MDEIYSTNVEQKTVFPFDRTKVKLIEPSELSLTLESIVGEDRFEVLLRFTGGDYSNEPAIKPIIYPLFGTEDKELAKKRFQEYSELLESGDYKIKVVSEGTISLSKD